MPVKHIIPIPLHNTCTSIYTYNYIFNSMAHVITRRTILLSYDVVLFALSSRSAIYAAAISRISTLII